MLQKRSSGVPGGRISVLLKRSSGVLGALGRIAVLLKRSRSSGALERDGSIICSVSASVSARADLRLRWEEEADATKLHTRTHVL